MTKRLTISRRHHLDKLHDELLAAIPALAPKANDAGEREAVFTLSGDGGELVLEIPDDVDEAAVAAVVNAHDPTPPPPPPPPLAKRLLTRLEATDPTLVTATQLRAVFIDELRKGG